MAALWKSWHWYECSHFELQPNWFHQQSWLNFNVFFNIYSRAFIKRMKKKWMFDVVFSKQNERTALRQTYKYYVYVESMVIPPSPPPLLPTPQPGPSDQNTICTENKVFSCADKQNGLLPLQSTRNTFGWDERVVNYCRRCRC